MLQAGAEAAIPKGATILITGVSGYVGSHVADQTLAAGYRVRGLVRDKQRSQWLCEVFGAKYGQDHIELAEVPSYVEYTKALDSAVEGTLLPADMDLPGF